mgnify:CR=1 FL=1
MNGGTVTFHFEGDDKKLNSSAGSVSKNLSGIAGKIGSAFAKGTAVAAAGIVNGYEDGTFRPENHITRAEFAKLVLSAYQAKGGVLLTGGIGFDDVCPYADVPPAGGISRWRLLVCNRARLSSNWALPCRKPLPYSSFHVG